MVRKALKKLCTFPKQSWAGEQFHDIRERSQTKQQTKRSLLSNRGVQDLKLSSAELSYIIIKGSFNKIYILSLKHFRVGY
jgi:hypothetical protein